jgi:IS605 OrfB family transposase
MYDGKLWLLISFEDIRTVETYQPIKDRILGIDMNPNYIGVCILQNEEIIHSYQYDIKQVEGEKQKYELIKITQDIISKAKHYLVEQIAIEKLNIETKDHGKGKRFNRLVNNKWDRNHFINQLEKRCKNELIKIRKLPAAFSSIIGNLITELPDPQASAYEMTRRATCSNYPSLQLIINPRKKEYFINCNDWRDVADEIKKSGLKYRNFLSDEFTSKFRFMSINSNVITSYVTI